MKTFLIAFNFFLLTSCCNFKNANDIALRNKLLETQWVYQSGYKSCGEFKTISVDDGVIPSMTFYKDHFVTTIGDCKANEQFGEDATLFIGNSWFIENEKIFIIENPREDNEIDQPVITVYPILSVSKDSLVINQYGHRITLKKAPFEKEE